MNDLPKRFWDWVGKEIQVVCCVQHPSIPHPLPYPRHNILNISLMDYRPVFTAKLAQDPGEKFYHFRTRWAPLEKFQEKYLIGSLGLRVPEVAEIVG